MESKKLPLISLHGGHSGQFCCHAKDSLEEIIQTYVEKGFSSVGITEHAPPLNDAFLYPDEKDRGLTAKDLFQRFADYIQEVDRLRHLFQDKIRIFKGFETETITGYIDHTRSLIDQFRPDYIVGSVHHVRDICFDYSKEAYDEIAQKCGSVEAMYLEYFDLQYEMIQALRPFVVGHFDLIRIYDPDYEARMKQPRIQEKIQRNLVLIQKLGLTLDFNLRPLTRGENAPYLTRNILTKAKDLGIWVVPGDDSHSKIQAGAHVDRAVKRLQKLGFNTQWPEPQIHAPQKE